MLVPKFSELFYFLFNFLPDPNSWKRQHILPATFPCPSRSQSFLFRLARPDFHPCTCQELGPVWCNNDRWGAWWPNAPVVNFTNNWRAAFEQMFFCKKLLSQTVSREKLRRSLSLMKKLLVKCLWNWPDSRGTRSGRRSWRPWWRSSSSRCPGIFANESVQWLFDIFKVRKWLNSIWIRGDILVRALPNKSKLIRINLFEVESALLEPFEVLDGSNVESDKHVEDVTLVHVHRDQRLELDPLHLLQVLRRLTDQRVEEVEELVVRLLHDLPVRPRLD